MDLVGRGEEEGSPDVCSADAAVMAEPVIVVDGKDDEIGSFAFLYRAGIETRHKYEHMLRVGVHTSRDAPSRWD